MDCIEDAIREAKRQLPQAFTTGCKLPSCDEVRSLNEVLEGAKDPLAPSTDQQERVVEAVERANEEQGIEYLAFYVSFHNPTAGGKWGIFYWDQSVRQFGAKVMRDLKVSDPDKAKQLAVEIVRRHELFHFRFDLYALHQELSLRRPLYNRYHQKVYSTVWGTDQCYEESLANRCCAYEWPRFSDVGQFTLLGGAAASAVLPCQVEDFLKSLWAVSSALVPNADSYRVLSALAHEAAESTVLVEDFVKKFCQAQPAGYKDFEAEPTRLRSRLGGQLLLGRPSGSIPAPQAAWVAQSPAFAERAFCPEYVLINTHVPDSKILHLRVSAGRRVWHFIKHGYGEHPWERDPHGHSLETGEKLDIKTGLIYKRTPRHQTGWLSRKDLEWVRQRVERGWQDRMLPPLTR